MVGNICVRSAATDISNERILMRNSCIINIYLTDPNREWRSSDDFDYKRPVPNSPKCNKFRDETWANSDSLWHLFMCEGQITQTNIYAVQQDTQSVSMSEFYSAPMLARHVSDLIGPSSGASFISCIRRLGMWYYAYYSTRPAVTKL